MSTNPIYLFLAIFAVLAVISAAVGWFCILGWELVESVAEMPKNGDRK